MEKNIQKDIKWFKALSLFEGVCFFVAGICALVAGNILGYISGIMMVALGCSRMYPVFVGGDEYFLNLGMSLAKDMSVVEYYEHKEDEQE